MIPRDKANRLSHGASALTSEAPQGLFPPITEHLPAIWRLWASLLLAVMLAHFVVATRPVRLANDDDVMLQRVSADPHTGALERYFANYALREGRFYPAISVYSLPDQIYAIRGETLFATARGLLLWAQFALVGWLVARLSGSEAAGWLCLTASAGALHIPAIFYPVLSYPIIATGSIALLLALHCYLSSLRRSGGWWLLAAGCLHLYALICHENFIVFTLLYPGLDWASRQGRRIRDAAAQSVPLFVISAAYAGCYVAFKRAFPSGYDGTVLSLHPGAAVLSWLRQTLAAFPGFELLVNRGAPYPTVGPLWKSAREIGAIVRALPALDVALALATALVSAGLARQAAAPGMRAWRAALVLLIAAALPNVLPSLTQKYQESAHHRFYPYVYSFSCYYLGAAAAACLWAALCGRLGLKCLRLQIAVAAFSLLLFALFASALASNAHSLALLKMWFN